MDEFCFGARTVSRAGHVASVAGVFHRVATRYDLMNDLMSVGLHRAWKRSLVQLAAPRPGEHWLDLAAGSGDITARLATPGAASTVVAADVNAMMLAKARQRCVGLTAVRYAQCSAEALSFADASFDGVTCAFGLRNFTEPAVALREVARVLRPGGRIVVLEFVPPTGPLANVQRRYLTEVLPALGASVAQDEASYRYLAESIIGFAPAATVSAWLGVAGLVEAEWASLALGAVALHRAWKT